MCTVLLPSGVNPVVVKKYIISYHIIYRIISYHHIVLFVCKCVLYYCHRVATQLQLRNISYHISYIYHISFVIYHIIYIVCV